MFKGVTRLLAFFGKEVSEIRRQPKLVLSLILGPFLILLLFGIGYQGDQPLLKTALVVPPELANTPTLDQMKQAIQANFQIVSTGTDRDAAMAQLQRGEVEVVEIIPAGIEQTVMAGKQAQVDFKYNEINPLTEQWVQYLGYAQVTELNKTILRTEAERAKQESGGASGELADAKRQLDQLHEGSSSADPQQVAASASRLNTALGAVAASPALASQVAQGDAASGQQQIAQLREDLTAIEQAAKSGSLAAQQERIERAREKIAAIQQASDTFRAMPSEVIVSPMQQTYENIYGTPPDFMTYYAPGVLALIVQHIAVTLGALSLVRERLLGAIEFYGVAPVSLTQVLAGKYLAYTLFIGIIIAVLLALMLAIGVPLRGDVALFAGVAALFVLAGLGVGFGISAISSTDSQAVQLSMLVLLLSIFFSGFFLPLENFSAYVRPVGWVLPLTYGIQSFQELMLRGHSPSQTTWAALAAIAVVMFVVVQVVWRQQFRRLA